jgi:hypothetical protein
LISNFRAFRSILGCRPRHEMPGCYSRFSLWVKTEASGKFHDELTASRAMMSQATLRVNFSIFLHREVLYG